MGETIFHMKHSIPFLVVLTSLYLSSCGGVSEAKRKFLIVREGDSLFMKGPKERKGYIEVGIIERVEILDKEELRRIKYSRKDTIGFKSDILGIDRSLEECLYKSGSSFIGICLGKDSIQTEYGMKYLIKFRASHCIENQMGKSLLVKHSKIGVYYTDSKDTFLEDRLSQQ